MSEKENKEVYVQVVKELNAAKGDIAKIRSTMEKHCAPGFITHHARAGDMNLEQVIQHYNELWTAFPDLVLSIDDLIAQEDKLAARATGKGTHQGTYMGIPATGKQITIKAMQFGKIEGGKAVEIWEIPDALSMMAQVGLIPDPAQR